MVLSSSRGRWGWRVVNRTDDRGRSRPGGVTIALVACALVLLGMIMQAYSLLNWDHAVDLGLQNERFSEDLVESTRALESRGVAMADMVWLLPMTLFAIWGLARRRFSGLVAGFMVFAIAVYFPLVFAFQRWHSHPGTVAVAFGLWVLPSLIAMWGLWRNRDWFKDP